MPQQKVHDSRMKKIALVGNYIPRQCGIATFTSDLLTALATEDSTAGYWAVAMNDVPEGYPYPAQVRFEVNQHLSADYRLAADFMNMNRVETACLQHEFGIFGGDNGAHILELLSGLRMPLVTTLHTVIQSPSAGQMVVTRRIAQLSDRLVVMSRKAVAILHEVYGVPSEKIVVIPHGIPDVPFVDPNFYKDQFGVEGRKVILTFGLLSPGKGIETVIEALPQVVRENPEAVYIVLGATHPHIRKDQGESYRLSLQSRARELGVGGHIIFHNRFVDLEELCEFIGAADIYVTPYLNREQIVSGTLAYALGSGKATISTPYWYAEEMLADGRGRIVPFRDTEAMAREINSLLAREVERHTMRKRAYTFCRDMTWKEVARRYLEVFKEVKEEREKKPKTIFRTRTLNSSPRDVPQPKLDHIARLTDDVGIMQHAKFIIPDRRHGYCTDDNARALMAVLMAREMVPDSARVMELACTYLSFLHHAFDEHTSRFRNFMDYERRWKDETGSQDSHGRALWSLGEVIALVESNDIRGAALELFERALPAVLEFDAPRSWAFALGGIHAYLQKFSGDSEARRIQEKLAVQLYECWRKCASDDWPWIEENLTYDNGSICRALITSGNWMQREDILEAGLISLAWLMRIQTGSGGHFAPVGNKGWFPRGGVMAHFDQQPIEALSMIKACRAAYDQTRDAKWLMHARRCLEWFLGRNDLGVHLYDQVTGGCCDGLQANGPNLNQGAESTLSCFLSLINLHQINAQVSLEGSSEGRKDIHQEPVVPSPLALSREIKNRTVIDEGTDISSGRITAGT